MAMYMVTKGKWLNGRVSINKMMPDLDEVRARLKYEYPDLVAGQDFSVLLVDHGVPDTWSADPEFLTDVTDQL